MMKKNRTQAYEISTILAPAQLNIKTSNFIAVPYTNHYSQEVK